MAGPQMWSNGLKQDGGATQYEIMGTLQEYWFKPLFETENKVIEFFNKY